PDRAGIGVQPPELGELVPLEPSRHEVRLDVPAHETRLEDLVSGWNRRVRREDRRGAHRFEVEPLAEPLEREEGGMALVHVEDGRVETERAQGTHAADAEHELLAEPVLAVAAVE